SAAESPPDDPELRELDGATRGSRSERRTGLMIVLGVIPARLASTRLPRKVLREIRGKPMIAHVYERSRRARVLTDLMVATDADEVVAECKQFRIPAIVTGSEHRSGTDRVWEVAQGRGADVF